MPHLVVRQPAHPPGRHGGTAAEHYLGVAFIDAPTRVVANESAPYTLALMYWPNVDYGALSEGTVFEIREGSSVGGFGRVLGRRDPPGALARA